MRPNLNTQKKRHGTFFYPGQSGFKFEKSYAANNSMLFRIMCAAPYAMGIIVATIMANMLWIGIIFAFGLLLYAASGKAPKGVFGNGTPPPSAEDIELERKAMEKIDLRVKSMIATETKADKDIITALRAELDEIKGVELKAAVATIQGKLAAMEEKGAPKEVSKKFRDALKDALNEKATEIKSIIDNNGKQTGPLVLEVKAAVTMGMDNTIEAVGSESHYSLTSNTGIISTLRKRIMTYLEAVSIGGLSIDKPYAMWIEELDEQGNPIFIGEGDDKIQLSVRYEEREKKAKKIAVYGKVTTEMLKYLPQLINYIQNNLVRRMDIKTEDQLFNGDDTGDNLAGILPYATAFDGGVGIAGGPGLVGLVVDANNYDVIRAVALQVYNSYGMPNKIFILPDILAQMEVAKDNEGRYLLPPFTAPGSKVIAGIELVPTNALVGTGYDFVGGDLTVVNVSFLSQSTIQIGLDGNDFTKNKKTILVEQELVQFVSANDTQVLVKGDMDTAKALLEYVAVP